MSHSPNNQSLNDSAATSSTSIAPEIQLTKLPIRIQQQLAKKCETVHQILVLHKKHLLEKLVSDEFDLALVEDVLEAHQQEQKEEAEKKAKQEAEQQQQQSSPRRGVEKKNWSKRQQPANDGFIKKLLQTFDSSISQSSIDNVLSYLTVATIEFWTLSHSDILSMLGEEKVVDQSLKITNALNYLSNVEHWNELKIPVDAKSVEYFLSKEDSAEAFPLDSYRTPEFVSQLVKVTPKKCATIEVHSLIFRNFVWKCDESRKKLLGSQEVVNSVVASSQYIGSADAVQWWSLAITNIMCLESNRKLFGCQSIVDSFVTVSKFATNAASVEWWSSAMSNITTIESNRKIFACSSIVNSFVVVSKYATTAIAVRWWVSAINNIMHSNDADINRVFSSSGNFKQVFFNLKQKLEKMSPEDEDARIGKKCFGWIEEKLF